MDKNEKKEQEEIINKLSKQPEEVEIVKEEEDQDRARWLYNNRYKIILYLIGKLEFIYWVKNLRVIQNKGKKWKKNIK